MKLFKKIYRQLALAVLSIMFFLLSAQWSSVRAAYADWQHTQDLQQLVATGVVDAVVRPSDLGLDYLEEPVDGLDLYADVEFSSPGGEVLISSLMGAIRTASAATGSIPEVTPLPVVPGLSSPISQNRMPGADYVDAQVPEDVVIDGYRDTNGTSKTICPPDIQVMTTTEAENNGMIPVAFLGVQEGILADASHSLKQQVRYPSVDVIARGLQTGRRYLIRDVNINSLCRDAINTYFNGYWDHLVARQYRRRA